MRKSGFMPTTVHYSQPMTCACCPTPTTRGIQEYDAQKVPTERPLCEVHVRILEEEYKAYFEGFYQAYARLSQQKERGA